MTRSAKISRLRAAARRCGGRLALLASLLTLAACGPAAGTAIGFAGGSAPRPSAAEPAPARLSADRLVASDGASLPLRKWLPEGPVKAVVLALHGFNDYSHAFEEPAKLWAAQGIATYAYDQRGFGGAPERGRWAGGAYLAVDAITASRLLRRAYPGRPLYLLGESMGGAVAILAASGAIPGMDGGPSGAPVAAADGVILCAPAVWGRETMDLLPKLALFAGVRLFPDMVLTGRGLRILASDNIPMLRALGRDPMVLKGARVDTVYGLVNLMDDALAAAPRLTAPTLLLYGAHDELVPRRPIAEFVAHLPPDEARGRTLAFYPKGYHMLLRDLEGPMVTEDVASWMLDRRAPLPSHADSAETARPWPPPTAVETAMPLAEAATRR